ncbi:MAG: peptide deformylase [Spirochaetaceae bacterium]|nr:MAG: peptide deformylase [Spirochaetaceae bacterium]
MKEEQTVLKIIRVGDERLRKKSLAVKDFDGNIETLVAGMFESMYRGNGIGLAAVQVGSLYRVFITHAQGDKKRVFINPEITGTSVEEILLEEGCLSVPQKYGDVKRPESVTIQAYNENGRPFTFNAEGILARVIQHELDHLNGILFIDYLEEKKRNQILKAFQQKVKM